MGFFIAGSIFLLLSACMAIKNWRRRKKWLRTRATGQIRKTYVHRDLQGNKTLMDQVRYRFMDSRGRTHSFDVHDYSGFRDKELEVFVLYDPENPRNAVLENTRDMYGWTLGGMVVGLWLLIFGFLATK